MPFDHFHFTNFASFSYGCTVFPFSLTSKRTSKLGELTLGILCYPFCSRSEYVIYKLKEMGKVSEKDVMQISNNFDRLDTGKCGKITLADLLESHHWHENTIPTTIPSAFGFRRIKFMGRHKLKGNFTFKLQMYTWKCLYLGCAKEALKERVCIS